MNANVVITDVSLKPNPVYCGERFIVSAKIEDVVFALEGDGYFINDNDGAFILAPDAKVIYLSTDTENEVLADATRRFYRNNGGINMADTYTGKKVTDLTENTALNDADLFLIGNAGSANLRKIKWSNILNAIKNKIAAWTFDTLKTTDKTLPGAVNELNSKTRFETYENISPSCSMTTFNRVKYGNMLYITTVFESPKEISEGTSIVIATLDDPVDLNYSIGVNSDGVPMLFWANSDEINVMPMGASCASGSHIYGEIYCILKQF